MQGLHLSAGVKYQGETLLTKMQMRHLYYQKPVLETEIPIVSLPGSALKHVCWQNAYFSNGILTHQGHISDVFKAGVSQSVVLNDYHR